MLKDVSYNLNNDDDIRIHSKETFQSRTSYFESFHWIISFQPSNINVQTRLKSLFRELIMKYIYKYYVKQKEILQQLRKKKRK